MDARIELLEAVDRLDLDGAAWLQHMLDVLGRRLEPRRTLLAMQSELDVMGSVRYRAVASLREDVAMLAGVFEAGRTGVTEEDTGPMYYSAPSRHTLSSLTTRHLRSEAASEGVLEFAGINCPTRTGSNVVLGAITSEPYLPSDRERTYWNPLARHLAGMLRLRARLARTHEPADAVLDETGRTLHAERDARQRPALDLLRHAVRQRERARRRGNRHAIWPSLAAGQWSIVSRDEHGGRRILLAYRNDPLTRRLRALTSFERQVVTAAATGAANKATAIDARVSESAVSRALDRALRKLGSNIAEVAWLQGAERRDMALAGERFAYVWSSDMPAPAAALSEAERAVLALALRGHTSREIAVERGRAERTVVNQLASIYSKLGVTSRRELVLAMVRAHASD